MFQRHKLFVGLLTIAVIALVSATPARSQSKQAPAKGDEIDYSSFLKTLRFRNIGPANMGGRVVDFAVPLSDTSAIYAAV